jgi:large subunit ribosomal protein L28
LKELEKPGRRVHDEPDPSDLLDYKTADKKTGRIERVTDTPIPVWYPINCDTQIWGGEGLPRTFFKYRTFYGQYTARAKYPNLFDTVMYSEILDKYMKVTMTEGAMMQVDEAQGFDNYLLKTPVQDFKSRLALRLRRHLLIALAKETYYPDDDEKRNYIKEKYKEFVIPLEEAEFVGLTISEATTKIKIDDQKKKEVIPLKVLYAEALVQELKEKAATGELEVQHKSKKDFSVMGSIAGLFGKKDSPTSDSKTS